MNTLLLIAVLFPLAVSIPGYFVSKRFTRARELIFCGIMLVQTILVGTVITLFLNGEDLSIFVPFAVGNGISFRADEFRLIYSGITVFLWLMTVVFSKEYMHHYEHKERYYFFYAVTLSGVMGVFLSDDLFTTFCFFEIMSFASYPLVIHDETKDSMNAGETYLGVAVISGMILLAGLFLLENQTGTLAFDGLRKYFADTPVNGTVFAAGILILLGFGAKAGMFPLHIWLPKAHPVAPAPASALLSGILTKTGVFGIIVISADIFSGNGTFGCILLSLAVITMLLGALLALFSVNLKRTLACSSMSQIGFILVGVSFSVLLGEEGGLAQTGALLHMANHSLIKLVLFMAAGVVAMNIHQLDLNEIRGFGRKKPFLKLVFIIGALGIMGIPLLNGYASKTMIHESIVEFIETRELDGFSEIMFRAVEWIFLISGGLTVAYMTKLYIALFVRKNNDSQKQKQFDSMKNYISPLSKSVFILSVIPLIAIGVFPNSATHIVSSASEFFNVERLQRSIDFFGWESLKGAAISILIGTAVYILIVEKLFIRRDRYVNLWRESVDLEKMIYRPIITDVTLLFVKYFVSIISNAAETIIIKGTVLFTLYVVRFFAQIFDRILVFLDKTVLKSTVYRFREQTLAMQIGTRIDKIRNSGEHKYENKADSVVNTFSSKVRTEYNSFSFAYAMISFGIIVVLLFVLLR